MRRRSSRWPTWPPARHRERHIAMPDIHWGYGFPIGGVAAMDGRTAWSRPAASASTSTAACACCARSCGTRTCARGCEPLVHELIRRVPRVRGRAGGSRKLDGGELERARSKQGAAWVVRTGTAPPSDDLGASEEGGCIPGADPARRQPTRARARPHQLGTLGSGNHFLEVQVRRTRSRRRGGARLRPRPRPGRGDDPHRLARPRPPGLHRLPGADGAARWRARHRAARPAARLRAARSPEGQRLPRRPWRAPRTSPSPTAR